MSFKRTSMDNEGGGGGFDNDEPFHKRARFGDDGGFRGGRGRGGGGRGRGGGRGGGGGFRGGGRGGGGFNKFNNDGDDDNSGFRGRGRGGFRGGGRFDRDGDGGGFRGRGGGFGGRGRGGDRGGGRGFGGGRGRGGDRGGRGGFGGRGGGRGGFGGRGGGGGGFNNYEQREGLIKVGQTAPDFNNILNDKSESVSLKQFRGKYVVLFIYFKDTTYGCTTEQVGFRDLKEEFDKHNAVILGVSRDDTDTHENTVKKENLNFSLLADTNSEISRAYGALNENDRVERCSFIISPEGKVVATWPKIFGYETHAQQVLDKLQEVSGGGGGDANANSNNNNNNKKSASSAAAAADDNDDDDDDDDVDDEENENQPEEAGGDDDDDDDDDDDE